MLLRIYGDLLFNLDTCSLKKAKTKVDVEKDVYSFSIIFTINEDEHQFDVLRKKCNYEEAKLIENKMMDVLIECLKENEMDFYTKFKDEAMKISFTKE